MPKFQYTARNLSGGKVSGNVEAEGEIAAARLLENRELFPIDVWNPEAGESAASFRRRISSRDLGVMYGQLSDLLGSGVPLLRALKSLVKSTVNKRLAGVLREIHNEVADGQSLHESMAGHQDIFPTLHTVMVQAGERASFLDDVLESLSRQGAGCAGLPKHVGAAGRLGDDRGAGVLRAQVRADAGRHRQTDANRDRLPAQ